ncbi:MAG: hypothetical protein ACYS83_04555 [Planctomycetota bacterium]
MKTYIYANSRIIAHELGHGAFSLGDLPDSPDADNLMRQPCTCGERLRKDRWITIQSKR